MLFKQGKAVSVGIKPIRAPGVPIEVSRELTNVEITWIKSPLYSTIKILSRISFPGISMVSVVVVVVVQW